MAATAAVVVVWQDREETFAALRSLAAMDQLVDRVIVVAQECSEPFVARLRAEGQPAPAVLVVSTNVGFASAANRGVAEALAHGAEWILLVNNDATVDPSCLRVCLAEAEAAPRIAVVGPAVRIMDRPDQLWFAGGVHHPLFAYTRHRGLRAPAASPPPSADVGYVSGCCALVSAAAWRAVGSFRDDFFLYYEDVEWCHRAQLAGWRCRYVGATLCAHALGVSSGQRGSLGLSENTAYYLSRNPLRFALDTPAVGLRVTRTLGILGIWGAYNLSRIVRAPAPLAALLAYGQGTRDAVAGRMGRRSEACC